MPRLLVRQPGSISPNPLALEPPELQHLVLRHVPTLAVLAILVVAGGVAVGGRVLDANEARGLPDVQNAGQPFSGIDLQDLTPHDAADLAAAKGYAVRWQIEDHAGTATTDDDRTMHSEVAPACGAIQGARR